MELKEILHSAISMILKNRHGSDSLPPVMSYTCVRCGWSITAHVMDGMSVSLSMDGIRGRLPNLSPFKHVLALTSDGNGSILCASELSDDARSAVSGKHGGTYSIAANSSGMPCGCDPGASWVCERHQQEQDEFNESLRDA